MEALWSAWWASQATPDPDWLHRAAADGCPKMVARLCREGLPVDRCDAQGDSVLHAALRANPAWVSLGDRALVLHQLIHHGAPLHARNRRGQTPLECAQRQCPDLVLALVHSGLRQARARAQRVENTLAKG